MSKSCPTCGKKSIMGGRYSNRVRAEQYNPTGKKRRYPNLQWAALPDGKRIKVCACCLKKGKHLSLAAGKKKQ